MAVRAAILDRNAALRNVANSPPTAPPGGIGRPSFEAAMSAVLQKSSSLKSIATGNSTNRVAQAGGGTPTDIVSTFQAQLQNVSALGDQEDAAAEAYERGETTDIAKVMLASQRSSVAFEATLQVRNKLLSAYKDIMSMAI